MNETNKKIEFYTETQFTQIGQDKSKIFLKKFTLYKRYYKKQD